MFYIWIKDNSEKNQPCFTFLICWATTVSLVLAASVDVQPFPVATVTEGAELWLTCTYDLTGGTLGQLQWKGNDGVNVVTATPTATPPCSTPSENYSVECNLASNEVRLGILNPVHGDTYSCTVLLSDFTSIGPVSTQVAVIVPVSSVAFTFPVSDTVTVPLGSSQVYTCMTGSSRPPARIDWYKDGVNVTTQTGSVSSVGHKSVTTSSLTLTGSKGDTPVTVQCRASNVDGMSPVVSGDKTFVVEWAPDGPPVISGYTSLTILYVNDTLSLRCRQPGGSPLATLTWSGACGGIPTTNSNTATEAVSDISIAVSKDYNQATCTCVSTHPQPQSQDRAQVTFNVHYPPSFPVINQTPTDPWLAGQNGTLRCSYNDGFPTLTRIEWFRDGLQTGQSTSSIILGPLSHTDNRAGYSCRVHNAFTDVKHTDLTSTVTHLNVEYKPLVTMVPTQLTVVEGKTAQVTCEAVGNPTPTLQWLRGGFSVHTGGGASLTLTLEDVDRSATANYICRAEGVSTVQGRQLVTVRNVSLLVQYPPDVSVVVPLTVGEGNKSVLLMCLTTGEPNTLISQSWTQTIGQSYITDQFTYETATHDTIVLSEVSLDDTGTYTCNVSNGIADRQGQTIQSNSAVLDVIVAPKFSGQNNNFYSQLHEPVTIKIPFYSNPPVKSTDDLEWKNLSTGAPVNMSVNTTFELLKGEAIDLLVNGKTVTFLGQTAVMRLSSFEQSLAGNYTVTIYNDGKLRQSTTNFSVTPSGPPEMPTNFRVIGTTTTSITVKWTKGFNGGHTQTFVILYGPEGGGITQTVAVVEQQSTYIWEITGLKPNTRYLLNMYAYNEEGNTSLSSAANIISKTQDADYGTAMSAIAGGVGGSVVVLLIIIAVIVVLYRRKKTGCGKDTSQRSDTVLFNSDHNVEEEDGMKRNILYESAGPYSPESQQDGKTDGKNEYAVVDKRNKNLAGAEYAEVIPKKNRKGKADTPAENGDIYAEVEKTGKEKGNGKEKKKGDKGEKKPKENTSKGQSTSGTVYENVDAVGGKPEELYANADDKTKSAKRVSEDQTPTRKKNQEGLVYLDVEFKESQNGTRQAVIHGIENRNDYALVDFTKRAEPLPEEDGIHNDDFAKMST